MKRLALALFLFGCNSSTSATPSTPPAASSSSPPAPATSVSAPAPASASSTCTKDGDCSKMSSYCGDLPCACVPYLTSAGAPKCNQPNTVKCLVDPCQRKQPACQDGKCVVTAGGAATQ